MKKWNHKQQAYSDRKVRKDTLARMKHFALFVTGIILLMSISFLIANPTIANAKDVGKLIGGTTTYSTLLVATNIDKVDNKYRAGKQTKYRMWFVEEKYVDTTVAFPAKVDGVRGTLVLLAGHYWNYIDAVLHSPEPGSAGEEADVGSTIKNTLPFIIGGADKQTRHLLEEGLGNYFYVVWQNCVTGKKFIGGNECVPLKLASFDGGQKKDMTGFNVSFANESNEMWCEYEGTLPIQAPTNVAADATTIALTATAYQYQLTSGTAAAANITGFTGVSDTDVGRVIEILGSGGNYPSTIDDDDDFLLEEGITWTANAGSKLTVKIFKDQAAAYKYIEVPGSRV